MLMHPKPGTRQAQPVMHGLGKHFESPRHSRDKTRTNRIINVPGQASKHCYTLVRLAQLQSMTTADTSESCGHEPYSTDIPWESEAIDNFVMDEEYAPSDTDHNIQDREPDISETQPTTSNQHIIPDPPAERLYSSWKSLIPTLVLPFLNYTSRMQGKPLPPFSSYISLCKQNNCEWKVTKIPCLLFDCEWLLMSYTESNCMQILSPLKWWAASALQSPKFLSMQDCSLLCPLNPTWLSLLTYSCSIVHFLSSLVMPSMPSHQHYIITMFGEVSTWLINMYTLHLHIYYSTN